jgi:hypothetical protein
MFQAYAAQSIALTFMFMCFGKMLFSAIFIALVFLRKITYFALKPVATMPTEN